jgi:putative transcriptional regulator
MGGVYNRIKAVLVEKNVSVKELAHHLGMHPDSISRFCTNHNQPAIPLLYRMAEFLEVEARELLVLNAKSKPLPKKKPKSREK